MAQDDVRLTLPERDQLMADLGHALAHLEAADHTLRVVEAREGTERSERTAHRMDLASAHIRSLFQGAARTPITDP